MEAPMSSIVGDESTEPGVTPACEVLVNGS
jgi:hypothetical protein